MKKEIVLMLLLYIQVSFAQTEEAWVYLKDKPLTDQYMSNPLTMLSQKALDRRSKQQISLDSKDVPVHKDYIQLLSQQKGITIQSQSKWLNAVHIIADITDIKKLTQLTFVEKLVYANHSRNNVSSRKKTEQRILRSDNKSNANSQIAYGSGLNQINMLGGVSLHDDGFTGKGMTIAIIDTGFKGVDTFDAFKKIRDNQQIKGGYDFVSRSSNVYTQHDHGTSVLSCIASYLPNQLVGTAPDADFYLFISEDVSQEIPLEESLWVEAAERADSLGVDIINTSLGYSTFDNPVYDYIYADMNGTTSFIARGLEIADSRGIMCVVAAGNEGADDWQYISTPADSPYALTVGAVDASGNYGSFSSIGPSSDRRIKPDVVAQGVNAVVVSKTGSVITSNGTSFSCPIMSGMVASLWQAFPNLSHQKLKDVIRQSAHLYNTPNFYLGYGIPNFKKVKESLLNIDHFEKPSSFFFVNPVIDFLEIDFDKSDETPKYIMIYDCTGRLIVKESIKDKQVKINTTSLASGTYVFKIDFTNNFIVDKFMVKR